MNEGMFGWRLGAVVLAVCLVSAVYLLKPLGVSTQFVVATSLIWKKVDPKLIERNRSSNEYINDHRKILVPAINKPLKNYGVILVLFMFLGGVVSKILFGPSPNEEAVVPKVWLKNFGPSKMNRIVTVFISGAISLFGARLAAGCTSGHMMSGIMQQACSAYLFTAAVFVIAIPVSLILYRK